MKYKKRSLKKKQRQQRQRQRHHFSKKYVQRGGGFMDIIAELIATEGRTHTCMAVHPTQPLVAVGDDAGTITLWEINQPQPKKLAQLVGLPSAVKCLEFHKTIPVVAGACSDRVLMWRFDQISRQQEQQREDAVQQLEPSHTVGVFELRSQEVVKKELSKTQQILAENKQKQGEIFHEQVTIENRLRDIEKKITAISDDGFRKEGVDSLKIRALKIERMLKQEEDFNKEQKSKIYESRGVMNLESMRRLRELKEEVEKQLEPLIQELKELQAQKKNNH
jgi:WD40 repeat protein